MANTIWSATDKVGVTLSGSNLIATATNSSAWVRATDRQGFGKFYWEYTANSGATNTGFGLGRPGVTPNSTGSGAVQLSWGGTIWLNGGVSGFSLSGVANGNIIGIAIDLDNSLAWFRLAPSGNWNNNASANPATAAGGIDISSLFGGLTDLLGHPLAYLATSTHQVTANFGDTAFSGAVPAGFTSGFPTSVASADTVFLAGTPREVLFTTTAAATAAGVVREVLLTTPTAATLAGVVREVLLLSPPPAPSGGQTIVTVNSG